MSTLCASPMAPPSAAIQIQAALVALPSPPTSILPTAQAAIRSAANSLPLSQTHSAVGPPTPDHIAPTPLTTPISSGSSVIPAPRPILKPAPTCTLTLQNSILGTSHTTKQNLITANVSHLSAFRDCEKLREAYINGVMPIDRDIDDKWNLIGRGLLDKILEDTLPTREVNQDLIYAAPRKFRKPRDSDFKPTVVVSVAGEQDRKRVKKKIKELKWLEENIRQCQLKLMVVINPVKLQAKDQAAQGTTSVISHEIALTADTSTAWLNGRQIILPKPSELTGEYTFTLGGLLVVDNKLYGLTAGHAFFSNPNPTTSSEPRPLSRSDSVRITNESLDDLRNPFVFDEDDTKSMGPYSGEDSASLASSLTENRSEEVDPPSRVPRPIPDERQDFSLPCTVVVPAALPHSPRVARNCDWALVELPRSRSHRALGVEHRVSGSKTTSERPSGDVAVVLSPNNVVHGRLSPNSASHGVGPYLFDVRLVVLQEEIQPGCSGAWVVQGGLLCGYIIAARTNRRWLYMIPIQKVYEDIRNTLGVQEVRVATGQDMANITLGLAKDLLHAEEDSTRAGTRQSSPEFLSQTQTLVAPVIGSSDEGSNEKEGSQIRPVDTDTIARSVQEPDSAQQGSMMPQTGEQSRSIPPQDNQPAIVQNPAGASADVEKGAGMDDQDPELLARRSNRHSRMSPGYTTLAINAVILAFQTIGRLFWYIMCLCNMRQVKKAKRVKWKDTKEVAEPRRADIARIEASVAEMQGGTQSLLPGEYYSNPFLNNYESPPFLEPRAPDLAHLREPPPQTAAA